eukprot:363939-Chlamydomonas_euryale.AAC.9
MAVALVASPLVTYTRAKPPAESAPPSSSATCTWSAIIDRNDAHETSTLPVACAAPAEAQHARMWCVGGSDRPGVSTR